MSLSKQLYLIISMIFLLIFTGNFIISVKNTKEYLETESITKAQDTATSLGMSLKSLLKDKTNPEIESIINAIGNSGFYKEIRLEDSLYTIKESDIISSIKDLEISTWKIKSIKIDEAIGKIQVLNSNDDFTKELLSLEEPSQNSDFTETSSDVIYNFIPNKKISNSVNLKVDLTLINNKNKEINTTTNLNLNKILVQVIRDEKFAYVPSWFIHFMHINLEEKFSEISDGWQTTAIIYVSANAGEAYAKLYEQVKSAIIYAIIAFLISMAVLFVFVQYLLKPLKRLESLANDISNGKFGTITKLPWTTEIKAVSIAFNDMSRKIEAVIDRLNNTLGNLTKKLSKDEVTGLALKQSFETDMKQMFINKIDGYVFVIKIFDLGSFAKSHTNKEVNEFISKFANILDSTKLENKSSTAYRFFGSEFALIGRDFNFIDAKNFTEKVQKEFEKLGNEYNKTDIAHIGGAPFNPIGTTPEILQSANQAYEKATLIGSNESFVTNSNDLVRDMESWRELVFDIIDNSKFDVRYIGDCKLLKSDNKIIIQEAFTTIIDKDNNIIPIGTFVSIAEKYERIMDFDKKVILKVINHILINNVKHDISINLSLESINNTAFIAWLEKKLIEYKDISNQLVFSATAYAVAKNVEKFKFFADEMHQCEAKVIIKRFETKFIPLSNLKDFNLDYIRLARDYTCDISKDNSKQSFVESISELANLINIKVLAENVQSDEDFEFIQKHNLYAASR